ncbi:hypothetical protein D3C72_1426020 [compost metagenome]
MGGWAASSASRASVVTDWGTCFGSARSTPLPRAVSSSLRTCAPNKSSTLVLKAVRAVLNLSTSWGIFDCSPALMASLPRLLSRTKVAAPARALPANSAPRPTNWPARLVAIARPTVEAAWPPRERAMPTRLALAPLTRVVSTRLSPATAARRPPSVAALVEPPVSKAGAMLPAT